MVNIHLYGELRRHAKQQRVDRPSILSLPLEESASLDEILQRIGIKPDEAPQIFLNRKLLTSPSPMAPWLGYVTATGSVLQNEEHLNITIHRGDRLGLFPPNMALLVI
jgi:hypothetical protein